MKYYLGMDIGGTKCSVVICDDVYGTVRDKIRFDTNVERGWIKVFNELISSAETILERNNISAEDVLACGVSCGGPLDCEKGIIMRPPNLPDWDNVPLADIIKDSLGFPCKVRNDADACALAEWKFGAGKGSDNVVFLTFGTGLGAGLILDGKLYRGANGNAGEVGHIRLDTDGPVAYGKAGSFEGFCSGAGIAAMGKKTRKVFGTFVGKMLPTFLASFVAFFLVGVWHGSSYKYVAYGLWNSIIISGSILLEPVYKKILDKLGVNTECFSWKLFQIARTFMLISIGRIFSRADSLMISLKMLRNMFSEFNPWVLTDGTIYKLGLQPRQFFMVFIVILIVFVVSLLQENGMKIRETLAKQNILFQWLIIIGAIIFLMIYGAYGGEFNAADFVYQQF